MTGKNYYYHSNTSDPGTWRGWFQYPYRDGRHGKSLSTQWSLCWRKKVSPGFCIHLGDSSSETPFDFMLSFYWVAIFFGCNFPGMGKFFEKIGRGHQRNISLKAFGGSLWWELWYHDQHGNDSYHDCDTWRKPKFWPWSQGRRKHRAWMCLRRGNIDLNPLDAIWGSRYYHYEVLKQKELWVHIDQFPGDRYLVRFKLEKTIQNREHGPKWVRHKTDRGYIADWWHQPGIPTQNHSWKGDNTLGSSVKLNGPENWETDAVEALIKWVKEERVKRNYRPRLEEDLSD